MFNAGVRGKRAKDGVGFLSTAEQFNQKSFLVPTVTSFLVTDVSYVPLDDTAVDTAGGETIVINGSGFASGATVQVGATTIGSVTFIDQNRLAFTAPALSSGSYTIYVTNSNGGTGILLSGLVYSGLPTFTTTAGTLGTVYETANINTAVVATGDAPITYSVISGTLPAGANINSNGTITGNAPVDGSSTTYSFTIQATDAQLQDSTRAFTLTINTDVLTWGLANNTVYPLDGGTTMSNVTLSATSSANSNSAVTFAANTLPTGVSLSGNTIFGTPTTEQTVYSTLTATATQTGRTATRFVSWVVSVSDLFFKYTTLAIQGADTTFVDDASTNNFAVTINGDTKPNSLNPYTPGYYSNYFDGSGDWLTIPNNTGFAFGSGAFTVEMWVNISGSSGTVANYSNGQSSNSNFSWELYQVSSTTIQFAVLEGATQYSSSSASFSLNKWNHIACVRNGNTLTIYVNGVAGGTTANLTGVTVTEPAGSTLKLCSYGNGSSYVTGYISNFRVVKGTAVYTAAFTPSTTPLTAISGTSVLTCQSNRFIDTSTNALTITVTGNTLISSFDPFIPNSSYSTYGSGYFDGTGDYLSVPYNSALALGSVNTWTMEYWVYFNASLGTYTPISHQQDPTVRWCVEHNASTTLLLFDNSTGTTFTNPSTLAPNTWYHIAFVRDGTTVRLYINGAVSVTTTTSNLSNITSGPLSIGRNEFGGAYFFYMNGYIADVRLVKGTSVYTSAFAPPTAPLTAISGTSLLTLQNNQSVNNSVFLDNSTNNFLVTRNGNTTQGTFSPYGGNYSNYFDGSGDYLTVPNNTKFDFSTGDFTVEVWTNHSVTSQTQSMVSNYTGTSNGWTLQWRSDTSGLVFGFGDTQLIFYSFTPVVGTWYHYAVTRAGTSLRLFINGAVVATVTNSTNLTSSGLLCIGNISTTIAQYTYGYLSNVRIIKGTALYTSAFTPSTTPLTPIANTSLLTCQSNRLIDNSINNFTITKAGDTSVQRFSPFSPSSVTPTSYSGYFDGNGDYLTVPSNAAFAFGTGDFTVEFWIYKAVSGTISILDYSSTGGFGCGITDTQINAYLTVSATYSVSAVVPLASWNHIAFVRSGTTLTTYLNGIAQGTNSTSANFLSPSTLNIGRNAGTGTEQINGYFSNLRAVKGTAVYTGAFTPPTTPLTAIANTSLLTCQSPTFIDNSTNNFTITAFGNSQPTIQNPFGFTSATTNGYTVSTIGGSGYFDGTGDYLTVPSNTAFYLSTGNWTIEAWIYKRTSGKQIIVGQTQNNGSPYAGWVLYVDNSSLIVFEGTNGALIGSPTVTVPLNAWTHVAIVKSSSTVTIYQNGVSVNSGSAPSVSDYNTVLAIGNYSFYTAGADWNGYISDLRIVKGTAIYSSNFVPPASPILSVQNTSLLTNMTSAGIYDAAMMNNIETQGDAKLSHAISKFGGTSMSFDGSGDNVYIPNAPRNQLGTADYTIEFWIYGNSWSTLPVILEYGRDQATSSPSIEFYVSTVGGKLDIYGGATTGTLLASYSSLSTATWTHIALTRASNTTRLFINGTQSGSSATDSTNYNQASILVGIFVGGVNPLNGYIDDLRITKGYARYTANFTAPISTFKIK